MLKWTVPSDAALDRMVSTFPDSSFTYAEVGATQGKMPAGYHFGHHESIVGHGKYDFVQGVELLSDWQQFDLSWVRLHARDRVEADTVVLVIARILAVNTLNPCRVVYASQTEDENKALFSYACGTLPGHDVQGEERFQLMWDKSTDHVLFRIDSFSRPHSRLAKALSFIARTKQRQFRRDASRRMQELIAQRRESRRTNKLANC